MKKVRILGAFGKDGEQLVVNSASSVQAFAKWVAMELAWSPKRYQSWADGGFQVKEENWAGEWVKVVK